MNEDLHYLAVATGCLLGRAVGASFGREIVERGVIQVVHKSDPTFDEMRSQQLPKGCIGKVVLNGEFYIAFIGPDMEQIERDCAYEGKVLIVTFVGDDAVTIMDYDAMDQIAVEAGKELGAGFTLKTASQVINARGGSA